MAIPTMVATGAVSFGVSLREVPAVILVFRRLLGSLELGLMISSDVSELLVGGPVTETALQLGICKEVKKKNGFFWF